MDSQKLLSIIASLYKFSSTAPPFIEKIISNEVPLTLVKEKTREGVEWDSNMALWSYRNETEILFQAKSDVWSSGPIFHYLAQEHEWERIKDRHVTITTPLGVDTFVQELNQHNNVNVHPHNDTDIENESEKTIDNEYILKMLNEIIHYRNLVLFWKSLNTYDRYIVANGEAEKNPDWIINDMSHFFGIHNPHEPSKDYWISLLLVISAPTVIEYLDALVARHHLTREEILDKNFITNLDNGIYYRASHLDDTEDTRDWVKSCWKDVVHGIKQWQKQNG
jgi:hypothetical protein